MIAWDAQGRAFFGSESSDDPAGTPKTFGDVWVATFDNPGGTDGRPAERRQALSPDCGCRAGIVRAEPAWRCSTTRRRSRPTTTPTAGATTTSTSPGHASRGNAGGVSIYFSRSTDHGVTFSNPKKVSQTISDVQFPDIAVTGNSNVYLVFRSFASGRGSEGNSIYYVKSTDCGATFTRPQLLQDFIPNDAQDVSDPEAAPPQSAPDDPGLRGGAERGRRRPRLRRLRRPLRVRLHLLPPRHAASGDRGSVRHRES